MKRALRAEDSAIIFLISFVLYQLAGLVCGLTMDVSSDAYLFVAFAVPQVCYIGVTFAYVKITRTEFRFLPTRESTVAIHYVFAILVGLGLFFFALLPNFGLQKLFSLIGKNPTVTVPDLSSPLNIFLGAVIICILPAIGEELIFRKVFVDGFSSYGAVAAIALSGVLFGLSHMNLAQTVHQIFLGCLLSFLYLRTKNITLTAAIHFINNLLALFLPVFTGEEVWNNLTVAGICFACGALALAGGIAFFVKKTQKKEPSEKAKPSLLVIGTAVFVAVLWIIVVAVS